MGYGENMPLDVLFVRDDDIPDLVQEDVCDSASSASTYWKRSAWSCCERGQAARFQQIRTLRFRPLPSLARRSRRRVVRRIGLSAWQAQLQRPIHSCCRSIFRDRDIPADIVTLSGAVEIAPRLGRADLICDLVSTGSTLQANPCAR